MTIAGANVRLHGLAVDHERAGLDRPRPAARSTPRHARDALHHALRRSSAVETKLLVNSLRGAMFASTPWLAVCRMSSNAARIWSVWTYVPAIIATPRRIAMAVSAERSLRCADARAARGAIMRASSFRWSRIASMRRALLRRRRSRPSARNRTRSANAAADGSCVTITIVWPKSSTARRSSVEHLAARDASRGCRSARRRTRPPGGVISARATATRCCWPPDSSAGGACGGRRGRRRRSASSSQSRSTARRRRSAAAA